jgi:hypothetical protein
MSTLIHTCRLAHSLTLSRGCVYLFLGTCCHWLSEVTPGHVASVGVPMTEKILSIWSISLDPGNRGLPT